MKSILLLAPKMDGPGGHPYNICWPGAVDQSVEKNRWKVVTPSLLLLATIAMQEGFDVTVVDEDFLPLPKRAFDLVCMYTVTPTARRAYRYAEAYRAGGTYVALGGVHTSHMQRESALYADTLLIGEGEYIFREFLRDYLAGRVRKIYLERPGAVNLEDSPLPLYDALRREERRLIPMQSARGCPHRCHFCNVAGLYGAKFRRKTRRQVADELRAILRLPEARRIYLTNDNLWSDPDHAELLFSLFSETGLTWYANADITFGENERQIRSAYTSGLRQVLIGLEGVTEQEVNGMDPFHFKSGHVQRYAEYIERIQGQGIGVTGSFIVGREKDTEETFHRLEDFIRKTRLFAANITMYTPYPGTPLYRQMKRAGKLISTDWNDYTIFQPVIRPARLEIEKLNRLYTQLLTSVNDKEAERNKRVYWMEYYRNRGKSS